MLIDRQRNRILVTDAIRRANETAGKGDLAKARNILSEVTTHIQNSASKTDEYSTM